MTWSHTITVEVKGPERENDRGYKTRDTLASFDVEVTPPKAWLIYQRALGEAVASEAEAVITFPDNISDEEAESIRRRLVERFK